MEFLDIVSEQDEVVGRAARAEIYERKLTHRIVHVYVFNSQGELALQRRSAQCDYCPLHFGTSAAGHVSSGETYEQAAQRELKEELGINVPLQFLGKEYYTEDPRGVMKFISVYRAEYDGDLPFDPKEVESVRWLSLNRVRALLKAGEPFTPQLVYILERYFST